MATAPFSIRMDVKLKRRLEKAAKRRNRSAGYVAQLALENYLDVLDYERKIIEEAMAEAEKGVFISAEKVHAWAETLGTEKEMPFPEPDIFIDKRAAVRKAS